MASHAKRVHFNPTPDTLEQTESLSQNDDEIYEKFRKDFPDLNVANLEEMKDLKSTEMKAKWREFCNEFKHVEDFSFATLIRLNSRYVHNCFMNKHSVSNTVLIFEREYSMF